MIRLNHLWLDIIHYFAKDPNGSLLISSFIRSLKAIEAIYTIIIGLILLSVLKGGYWETRENGTFWRGPGYMGFRKGTDRHSLRIPEGKSAWTIILVGPNKGI